MSYIFLNFAPHFVVVECGVSSKLQRIYLFTLYMIRSKDANLCKNVAKVCGEHDKYRK